MFKAFILWDDGAITDYELPSKFMAQLMEDLIGDNLEKFEADEGKAIIATGIKPVR